MTHIKEARLERQRAKRGLFFQTWNPRRFVEQACTFRIHQRWWHKVRSQRLGVPHYERRADFRAFLRDSFGRVPCLIRGPSKSIITLVAI